LIKKALNDDDDDDDDEHLFSNFSESQDYYTVTMEEVSDMGELCYR